MAYARICDRCGGVYGKNDHRADFGDNKYGTVKGVCVMFEETDRRGGLSVDGIEPRRNAYLDLCNDCAKQLVDFLRDKSSKVKTGPDSRY